MLSLAKQELSDKIEDILFKAYMTQYKQCALDIPNQLNDSIYAKMEDCAKNFASIASKPTTEAIYDFVKNIGITINIPSTVVSPATPILPGGPCSGVINETNITIY